MKKQIRSILFFTALISSYGCNYTKPLATKRYLSKGSGIPVSKFDLPVLYSISYDSASFRPDRDTLLSREPGFSEIINYLSTNKKLLLNMLDSKEMPTLVTTQFLSQHFLEFGREVVISGTGRFFLHRPVPKPAILKLDSVLFISLNGRTCGVFMDLEFIKRETRYDRTEVEGMIVVKVFVVQKGSVLYARTWATTSFHNRASPKLQLGNSAMDNVVWYPEEVLVTLLNAIRMDIRKSLDN